MNNCTMSAWMIVFGLALSAAVPAGPASARGANLIRNSSFECGVTNWMPMDGWFGTAVYDCPEALRRVPEMLEDGLPDAKLPDPQAQRTTSEASDGKHACLLDKWYETAYSAYVPLDLPGEYTVSAYMKATSPVDVKMAVVSAERGGPADADTGWEKATAEVVQTFHVGLDWQRHSFTVSLAKTTDGLYQVYFYLPPRRGGDGSSAIDKFGQRIDLRPRTNSEQVYVDAVQLQKGPLTAYQPASPVEVGARFLNTEDWLYVEGDTPVLEVQSGSGSINRVEVTVSDWQRKEVWQKTVTPKPAALAAGSRLPLDFKGRGYFRAFVRAQGASGGWSREVEMPFGIVPRQPTAGDFEKSPFGGLFSVTRGSYSSSWPKPGFHSSYYELDDRQVKTAAKIGMRWAKGMDNMPFPTWVCTEPEKGAFQWGDPQVRLLKKYGFHVYGKLVYVPTFAQVPGRDFHAGPPGDLAAWDNYVRKSFEHYRGDLEIRHWGVWTEPWQGSGVFWKGTALEYVDLLRRTYEIAKSVDPRIRIGGINGCSPFYKYQKPGMMEDIFRGDAMRWCDIYTYHRCQLYGHETPEQAMPDENDPTWKTELDTFRDWMDRYSGIRRPIWNTEFRQNAVTGYLDKTRFAQMPYAVDNKRWAIPLEDAVAWVVRAQAYSMANGVEKLFISYVDPGGVNYDESILQTLKEADGRPKPWRLSYAAMTYMLEGAVPLGKTEVKDRRVCSYLFQKGNDTVAGVWGLNARPTQLDKDGPGALHLSGNACSVVDVMGNEVRDATKNAEVIVPLRVEPYYLVFSDQSPAAAKSALSGGRAVWIRAD